MLMLTMPLLMTLSLLFIQLQHPLAMGLILLIQTVLVSITVGLSAYSFWFSYILFLVFLGGMLILFIYVASLASNEVLTFSLPLLLFFLLSLIISFMMLLLDPLYISTPTLLPNLSMKNLTSTQFIISWIYNTPSMPFTIFIIYYLLLMLIVVVKIVTLFKGPLRLIK
nr:NADH dehydrogenase subunit 6 [Guinusia dentipes]